MHPCGIGGSQAGAQVMGIGDSVQNQQQGIRRSLAQRFQQIVLVPGLERPHRRHRSLVGDVPDQLGERLGRHGLHPQAGGLCALP